MARIRLAASFKFIKYALFFFNLISFIFGIVIFSVGIYARISEQYLSIDEHFTGAYLFIFIGLIITITSFLGCYGAISESPCLLILFSMVIFFIFVVLMAAGLWAIAHKQKIDKKIGNSLSEIVGKISVNTATKDQIKIMDKIQNELQCCGVISHIDYVEKPPLSCGNDYITISTKKGCHESIKEFLKVNINKIIGLAIFVGIIMLLGMICSIMLCCAIKEAEKFANH